MSENFEEQVNIKVKKELEKKEFDKKLDDIRKSVELSAEVFPEVSKSLSGLRKSVEALNKSILAVNESQRGHIVETSKSKDDLNSVFVKVREVLDNMDTLEGKLVNRNNSGSLVEVVTKLINEQNKGMIDRNNPNSILSILKKDNNIKGWITWLLLTALSILTLMQNFIPIS